MEKPAQLAQELLRQLEEIQAINPNFGYAGRAGWIDEEDDNIDEWDVGEEEATD